MTNFLDKILAVKKNEVAAAQKSAPLDVLKQKIQNLPKCRNFYQAISKSHPRGINVIAEIKRASPSAGLIRKDFDPVALARTYESAGADALSILTDESFFQGHLSYLPLVKQITTLPILRKDFIIDPYQIYEARAAGADAVLLIAEALPPGLLMDLLILAHSLTLTVLLEVHDLDSLLQVRSLAGFPLNNYTLLGINNRNLKTMQTDLNTSLRLCEFVENPIPLISESGIREPAHVQRLIQAGFQGILIGETLMKSTDISAKFADLFGSP